jgi:putative transposase
MRLTSRSGAAACICTARHGDKVEFLFSEHRDFAAAKRFFRRALDRHGRPDRVVIDGSQTNHKAIVSCDTSDRLRVKAPASAPSKPISIRKSKYLNNRIEQDHRRINARIRPTCVVTILSGIELVHDAQTTGEVCRQSQPITGAFRHSGCVSNCPIHPILASRKI